MVNWTSQNERRCDLIEKEVNEGLSDDEQQELKALQSQLWGYKNWFENTNSKMGNK